MRGFYLSIIAAAAGCRVDVDYDGTMFRCAQPADCPPGFSCVVDQCVGSSGWWDRSFTRRIRLTFDHAGEPLADFPLAVLLDDTRIDYGLAQDRGQDVRFVDADGSSVLPHEIERWDELGTSVVWVRIPELDASKTDHVYLYYGNAGAIDAQDAASVWVESYRGVWHLHRDPGGSAPQVADSTSNVNHGAAQGGLTTDSSVAGPLGNAVELDGVDDFFRIPHHASLDIRQQLTLSAWVRMSALQAVDAGIIIKSDQAGASIYNYQLGINSPDRPHMRVRTPTELLYPTAVTQPLVGRWYYLTGVYEGATARFFIDGIEEASVPGTGQMIAPTTEPLLLGRRAIGDQRFYAGAIDEARVEAVARTSTWIRATYRSMTDALLMYGAQESAP
jgi:biopolymer transport protein ExbB